MPHTLAQKIVLAHTDADEVAPGDIVMVRCDVVMTNDISGPMAFRAMEKMGAKRVFDPAKVVLVPDHFVPAKDTRSAELQKLLREWAAEQGVTYYEQGRGGIEHTLLVEEGWVVPGSVIAGGDSHTCTYGALGAFGTGLGSTDIAACLASGAFWQAVPGTIRVEFTGEKQRFVTGKDLILAVIGEIGVAGGTNMALEFVGDGAEALSIDERLAVANMAVEAGSETGFFPADETVAAYLDGRTERPWTAERSDADAEFAQTVRIDLDTLSPLVAMPHSPGNVVPLDQAVGQKIDQVYIGNCSNGTMTDLRQAAEMLRGRRVQPAHPGDRRPGDAARLPRGARRGPARPLRRGRRDGLDPHLRRVLRRRRGRPCARRERDHDDEPQLQGADGLERGRGPPGERLGCGRGRGRGGDRRPGRAGSGGVKLSGRAVVIRQDDVDTDVLYPGEYLNVTEVEKMTAYLFEGLDPSLRDELGGDTALVVGSNFGAGSSREHVPQAMSASGIRFVVGKSFARIFYRNCINLGLPAAVAPDAVDAASPGSSLELDLDGGTVTVDGKAFLINPVPEFLLEMFAAGGLVPWMHGQLDATTSVG